MTPQCFLLLLRVSYESAVFPVICLSSFHRLLDGSLSCQEGAQTKRPETKRPETKRPWTKRPWGQNVRGDKTSVATKHPSDKTSVGTKRPSDKTSGGQNVRRDKTSVRTKRPWTKRPSGSYLSVFAITVEGGPRK
jgi:hypothetical protein